MFLLDRFAMAALTGMLALDFTAPREAAHQAYDFAEAMMDERNIRELESLLSTLPPNEELLGDPPTASVAA